MPPGLEAREDGAISNLATGISICMKVVFSYSLPLSIWLYISKGTSDTILGEDQTWVQERAAEEDMTLTDEWPMSEKEEFKRKGFGLSKAGCWEEVRLGNKLEK